MTKYWKLIESGCIEKQVRNIVGPCTSHVIPKLLLTGRGVGMGIFHIMSVYVFMALETLLLLLPYMVCFDDVYILFFL
jgi:hypothetical protein